MRRLAPAVILFLVFALGGIAQAQTCAPPVVTLVGGANPTCAGQPVTLDAGSGWATYQWSPGGATTQMISDTPSVTTSYPITTTDANGCTVTSQPLTVVVNAAPATPSIHLQDANICAAGSSSAYIDPPSGGGSWSSIQWSLGHATASYGSTSGTVSFAADGSGQSVTLQVTVQDANSCVATATAALPIRLIPSPVVNVHHSTMCASETNDAYIDPPPGGYWASVAWTADHATILYGQGNPTITFQGDGSGQPITLRVHVTDTTTCQADGSATISIHTITSDERRVGKESRSRWSPYH